MQHYENFGTVLQLFHKILWSEIFEELEMDAVSLYLAPTEKDFEHCIRLELKAEWARLLSKDCSDSSTADASGNFFTRTCCVKHSKHSERERGLFTEKFICPEMYCLYSET